MKAVLMLISVIVVILYGLIIVDHQFTNPIQLACEHAFQVKTDLF
jgi:hypothetical protein